MGDFKRMMLGGLLGGVGDAMSGYADQQNKERQMRMEYALKNLYPDKPAVQKEWEYVSGLPEEQRQGLIDYKSAANPMGMMNFQYKMGRDQLEDQRYQDTQNYNRQRDAEERAYKRKTLEEPPPARLPADKAALLAEGSQIPKMLDDLDKSLGDSSAAGPIMGRLRALNPYDETAKSAQAEIDAVKQFVGKYLEGGVLRKEDEVKYAKILPTMVDTPEVRRNKINYLRKLTGDKQNEFISGFRKAGYQMDNYGTPSGGGSVEEEMRKRGLLK